MKFDLHSDLANQITIENLKWHLERIAEDLSKADNYMHEVDRVYYANLFDCLGEVLDYFGEPE